MSLVSMVGAESGTGILHLTNRRTDDCLTVDCEFRDDATATAAKKHLAAETVIISQTGSAKA
jgi:hypothetical protein